MHFFVGTRAYKGKNAFYLRLSVYCYSNLCYISSLQFVSILQCFQCFVSIICWCCAIILIYFKMFPESYEFTKNIIYNIHHHDKIVCLWQFTYRHINITGPGFFANHLLNWDVYYRWTKDWSSFACWYCTSHHKGSKAEIGGRSWPGLGFS